MAPAGAVSRRGRRNSGAARLTQPDRGTYWLGQRRSATAPDDRNHRRDRRRRTQPHERETGSAAAILRQAVRQQQTNTDTERRAGRDYEPERR